MLGEHFKGEVSLRECVHLRVELIQTNRLDRRFCNIDPDLSPLVVNTATDRSPS